MKKAWCSNPIARQKKKEENNLSWHVVGGKIGVQIISAKLLN
jgi:hypothetical protein